MYLHSVGYCHPATRISNQFLEELDVGTNNEWILHNIGIEERNSSLPIEYIKETKNQNPARAAEVATHSPTSLGVSAAKMALDRAGIEASQIGMVICNTCKSDFVSPPESQRIAAALGIDHPAYDVFSACPAFALHMDYLNSFEPDELPDYILCISTAATTQSVNYADRTDGAIWGDGAAAWIVAPRKVGKLEVLDTFFAADPTRNEAVTMDRYKYFHQDGRAVRDFSVRQTVRLIKRLEENFEIDWSKDVFIGHQANRTMLQQVTNNRKIPDENHWHNVTFLGNQAGASSAAVLGMNWDKIQPGQKIAVAVVGAGLSWGSILFQAL